MSDQDAEKLALDRVAICAADYEVFEKINRPDVILVLRAIERLTERCAARKDVRVARKWLITRTGAGGKSRSTAGANSEATGPLTLV